MSSIDYLVISLYSAASLLCVVLLVKFLVEAFFGRPAGWRERARLKFQKRILQGLTAAFHRQDFTDASNQLLSAFYFDVIKVDPEVVEQVNAHHHSLLQQILAYGKANSIDLPSFEVLADLVISRTILLRSFHEAESNRRALQKKGAKKVPEWALEEYSKKIQFVKEKLETNKKSILHQFEKSLRPSGAAPSSSEEVIFH